MFAALNSSEATPDAASVGSRTANSTRPPSRKGSIDFGAGSVADTPQRRRLMLQPRTVASDAGSFRDDTGSAIGQSEAGDDESVGAAAGSTKGGMSADQAKRKIKEDLKELFMLRQLSEVEGYFTGLPSEFRVLLIKDLVNKAVDARPNDVQLIADVFGLVAEKSLVDEEQFVEGFTSDMEYLEDTSTDSPNAYGNVAKLLKAAKLSQAAIERYGIFVLNNRGRTDVLNQIGGYDNSRRGIRGHAKGQTPQKIRRPDDLIRVEMSQCTSYVSLVPTTVCRYSLVCI
jgi:hypothetical protein